MMDNTDTTSKLIKYITNEYPDIDIHKSKQKFRQREYEVFIINEILKSCTDEIFEDPIDILENYELIYTYFNKIHDNDIYKYQLNVIRKLLLFLRRK